MSKAKKISGFPEWLPEEKILENHLIDKAMSIYESHGFVPIETPAVELIETLTAKGVVDKEIYGLKRLAAEEEEESKLGLHFDLTVPFARYVATHFNDLVFPFKRYQLQKVWRGERPQKGRFREFYQFDADIVARDTLPMSSDAEVVTLLAKCLVAFKIGTPRIKLNNRKLLVGFLEGIGISSELLPKVVTVIDKLDKIGDKGVTKELDTLGVEKGAIDKVLAFTSEKIAAADFSQKIASLSLESDLAKAGASELEEVIALIPEDLLPFVEIHLQIARGLDYYSGTIVESEIVEFPEFGSVGSGGRYDDLVSQYLSKSVPGVGISLGISRLMELILDNKLLEIPAKSSAEVLLVVFDEENRSAVNTFAEELRKEGIATEVFFKSPKLGKQVDYANKKGIPYVVFLGDKKEVKNLSTGEQQEFSAVQDLKSVISA